jgi:hypothetical protein
MEEEQRARARITYLNAKWVLRVHLELVKCARAVCENFKWIL